MEIVENENLSDQKKSELIMLVQNKYKRSRFIGYFALYALIASLMLLFVAAISDGIAGTTILAMVHESQTLFAGMEGVLTFIVATCYKPKKFYSPWILAKYVIY